MTKASVRCLIVSALTLVGSVGAPAWSAQINWKVVNRFPVIRSDDDFQRIEADWAFHQNDPLRVVTSLTVKKLRGENKGDKPYFPIRKLNSGKTSSCSSKERLTIDNQYGTLWDPVCGVYEKSTFFNPKHTIELTVADAAPGVDCHWRFNGFPVANVPCDQSIRIPGVLEGREHSFDIAVDVGPGQHLTLGNQVIDRKLILALGDSFASGEGNPDLPTRWGKPDDPHVNVYGRDFFLSTRVLSDLVSKDKVQSAEWWDPACHRSLLSWQALYGLRLAMESPHSVIRFASFACSGAEIFNGYFRAQLEPPGTEDGKKIGVGQAENTGRDGGDVDSTDRKLRKLHHSQLLSSR